MLAKPSPYIRDQEETLPRWIRASKAAEILGVRPAVIGRMIKRGQLASQPHPIDPRGVLVDRDQVYEILARLQEIDENGEEE